MSALPPRPSTFRIVGPAQEFARGRAPAFLGATFDDAGEAFLVALGPADARDLEAVVRAVPPARDLPIGALVIVAAVTFDTPSFAVRLRSALGRGKVVPRSLRTSALLAQGYTRLGAAVDPDSRADIAWGFVPHAL